MRMPEIFEQVRTFSMEKFRGIGRKEDDITRVNAVDEREVIEYSMCEPFMPLRDGDVAYCPRIYDGDSITLAWRDNSIISGNPYVRIGCRIKGVDCPEMKGSSDAEKVLALKAKERMSKAVLGKFVTIREPATEKFGRVLSRIQTDEHESVADYMLEDPEICRPYGGGKKSSWD